MRVFSSKRSSLVTRFLVAVIVLGLPSGTWALDVKELIREIEQQYMGTSSQSHMTMQVRTSHWERTLEMEAWSLKRDYFLVRIIEPAKERDVATLKRVFCTIRIEAASTLQPIIRKFSKSMASSAA
ncbi:MAG: hypothetical protein P8Y91_10495 [Desulfuromonadales bacterium]